MLQADNAALEHYARIELERVCTSRNPITLDCESLKDVPEAVRRRTLKYAVEESGVRGGELVYWHIAGLDKLVTEHINKRGLDLPGVRAWRERNLCGWNQEHNQRPRQTRQRKRRWRIHEHS